MVIGKAGTLKSVRRLLGLQKKKPLSVEMMLDLHSINYISQMIFSQTMRMLSILLILLIIVLLNGKMVLLKAE